MATLHGKPLMSLRVVDLKEELEKRGLSKAGAKKDLVARLEEYILEHEKEDADDSPESSSVPFEDNPMIREYMAMRESQLKLAMEEKAQAETSSAASVETPDAPEDKSDGEPTNKTAAEDDEDEPLIRSSRKSSRGRKSSGINYNEDDSEDEIIAAVISPKKRGRGRGVSETEKVSPQKSEAAALNVQTATVEQDDEDKVLSPKKRGRRRGPSGSSTEQPLSPRYEPPSKLATNVIAEEKVTEVEKQPPPVVEKPVAPPQEVVVEQEKKPSTVVEPKVKPSEQPIEPSPPQKIATQSKSEDVTEKEVEKVAPEKTKVETKAAAVKVGNKAGKAEQPPIAIVKPAVQEKSSPPQPEPSKMKRVETPPVVDHSEKEALEATDTIVMSESIDFGDEKEKDDENATAAATEKVAAEVEKNREPVTFRKLSRLGSNSGSSETRKKRTWGDSNKTKLPDATTAVSSSELKDIVPDITPVVEKLKEEQDKMETAADDDSTMVLAIGKDEAAIMDEDEEGSDGGKDAKTDAAKALPKPMVDDPEEVKGKLAPVSEKNKNQSCIVEIRNLVRPFTNGQLVLLLKRTGSFEEENDFWIDKIKSHAMVRYQTPQEAEETVLALDGVKWPSSNQKKLIVTFSSEDHFERQSKETMSLKQPSSLSSSHHHRDHDQDHRQPQVKRKAIDSLEKPSSDEKRARKDSDHRGASAAAEEEKPKKEQKSLEVLFNKTKALPSIYWMPKS